MNLALTRTFSASAILLATQLAHAESDTVTAEALFQEGRALLEQHRFEAACPKLAESNRLDPATGTLIALAACHEQEGKLASAWSEFTDAQGRAQQEGRKDREELARDHAAALKPRLSTLTLEVGPSVLGVEGLEIRRDGVALGRGVWNSALPIDGGTHAVDVTAPGREPLKLSVVVQKEGDAARLSIPELAPLPPNTAASGPAPSAPATANKGLTSLQWAGVATAGVGVVSLGVGGVFLASALGKKSDSKSDCTGNVCGSAGLADRDAAVKRGNLASIFGLAGGALAITGVTLFVVGRPKTEGAPAAAALNVSFQSGPGFAGTNVSGTF